MLGINVFLLKVKGALGMWRTETEIVSEREVIKYFHSF